MWQRESDARRCAVCYDWSVDREGVRVSSAWDQGNGALHAEAALKRGSGPQRWISMGEKGPSGRGKKRREGGLGFGFGLISCFGFGLGPLFLFLFYSISKTNKHV